MFCAWHLRSVVIRAIVTRVMAIRAMAIRRSAVEYSCPCWAVRVAAFRMLVLVLVLMAPSVVWSIIPPTFLDKTPPMDKTPPLHKTLPLHKTPMLHKTPPK